MGALAAICGCSSGRTKSCVGYRAGRAPTCCGALDSFLLASGGSLSLEGFFAHTPHALTCRALHHHADDFGELTAHGRDNFCRILAEILDMDAIDLGGGLISHLALRRAGGPRVSAADDQPLGSITQGRIAPPPSS